MSRADFAEMHDRVRQARAQKHMTQSDLADRLNLPQPRISELENRLKSGNMTEQLKLVVDVAELLGLSLMMVPKEIVGDVQSKIQDFDIEQDFGRKSVFDQIFDEVTEFENNSRSASHRF